MPIRLPQTRRLRTRLENWSLFPTGINDLSSYKTIPPGEYQLEETFEWHEPLAQACRRRLG